MKVKSNYSNILYSFKTSQLVAHCAETVYIVAQDVTVPHCGQDVVFSAESCGLFLDNNGIMF